MSNQLAIYCAHAIQLYQGKTEELDSKILTSKAFIDFCQEHRILSRMEKMLMPYFLPGDKKDYFIARITADRIRALKQIAALNIIAKAFNKNGITWLSFKGPVLSYVLFGDATIRSSKDIDIWVPKSEIQKAHDILMQNNFSLKPASEKEKRRVWHTMLHKDDTYSHQPTGVELELHWRLIPGSYFTDKLIIENRRIIDFCQNNIPVFNSEAEFIYLCAHAGKSHWQRLSWLFDLYDYSQIISLEKQKIIPLSNQYHLDFYLEHALQVLNHFFHPALSNLVKNNKLINKISQKKITRILTDASILGRRSIHSKIQEMLHEAILSKSIKNFLIKLCLAFTNQIKK